MGEHVALTPDWAFVSYIENGTQVIGRFQASQNWAFQGSLTPPAGSLPANSITALAASPEALAVGAGSANRVHLHSVSPTGVTTAPVVIDRPQDRGYDEQFGTSVDVKDDLLLVGAPQLAGIAYVYRKAPASFTWTLEQELRAPTGLGDLGFGQDVAITDGIIAISAVASNGPGAVYTFRQDVNTGVWEQVARLAEESGGQTYFGWDIAATGEDLVIGSPATAATDGVTGAVYFATLSTPPSEVAASDGRYANRVQVRWEDQAAEEDGHRVYRLGPNDTDYVLVGTVEPNVEIFDDFDVAPGDAYSYCVASFFGEDESDTNPLGESGRTCDEGYTPPNGTISGRLATAEGAPVIGTGVCLAPGLDQAVMYDGLAGRAVAPAFGLLPEAFTIEAWFNSDANDVWRPVLGLEGPPRTDGQSNEIVIHAGPSPDGTARRTGLRMRNADGPSLNIGSFDLEPGWHHVAATHDGSNVSWYINGAFIATQPFAAPSAANGDFMIGGMPSYRNGFGPSDPAFDGRVDDVRVWSRAKTGAEIADAFENARPLGGDEPDLYAYWAMEQGTGRILTDLTEGGRHATLQGGAEWTRQGAPLNTCAVSDANGNYTFAGLRYGESTSFNVTPTDSTRQFTPGTRSATLTPESPTENQMDFTDTSAFTVRGTVVHAADQEFWPGQADLPAPEIEILVDGTVAGSSESDGTFAVAVRGSGAHVIEARSESFPGLAFTADFDGQAYEDGTAELDVTRDLDGLRFTNTTSRELRGQAAGGCERPIGNLTFRITTEDLLFDQTFTTDASAPYRDATTQAPLVLPPLAYNLEFVDIENIPETLDRADVVQFFRNLGVLSADLTTEADTVDFRYRAPIRLVIEGLGAPASACASGGYTVVDVDGNPRQTIPAVPVLSEYSRPPLTIRAFEDYGEDGGICPVDAGTLRIFDGFADADEPVEVTLENGIAQYTSFARSPDTFAGRTVAGVDRSYQKSLTAVLDVPDGPSVTETVWAVVEGYREKPATFVTATMSEIPVMILRDPPGTESSAFVAEETKSCTSFSQVNTFSGAGGVQLDLKLGLKLSVGFIVQVNTGGAFSLQSTTLLGGGVTQTNGPPESNMQVCATTTERWETRGDTGWSGEDLFAGVGLNVLFAEADVVETDATSCQVQLSTALATDFDQSDPFATSFVYGKTHIEETLIPELEDLARLAGDGAEIEGEEPEQTGEAPPSVTLRSAIDNWKDMIRYDSTLVATALEGEAVENRSFSGGTTYNYGVAADTTFKTAYESNVTFSTDTRFGGLISAGFDNFILGVVKFDTKQTFGRATADTEAFGTGYTLSDSDAGDYFSVDVARDSTYGTYVFNTVSGASSNPWEPNTQKRDNPLLAIDPPERNDIPDGDAAVFTLQLTNASESDERREYVLDAPPHLNPDGTTVMLGGAVLSEKRVLIEPNQTISFPITVERGPEADTSDVAIIAYSPFDHAIWRTAPQLGLVTADTARFTVSFTPSIAPVRLLEPEDGWVVSTDDPTVRLTLTDLDASALDQVGVEYRVADGAWQTVTGIDAETSTVLWEPPVALPDGAYEFRAVASRSGTTSPPFQGSAVAGVIDRTAPAMFGLPEPADEVLRLGEVIGMTFEEPIDCARLRREHTGSNGPLAELASPTEVIALDIGCVDNAL
ncbi:MAG: LamG domain-containing protein, partial [Bacteroidota bacterium]